MRLLDKEEIMKTYIRSERFEAAQEAERKVAIRMIEASCEKNFKTDS